MKDKLRILVTMAGLGSRFKKAGYHEPKHRIKLQERTLFEWSLRSLKSFNDYEAIFVCMRNEDESEETFVKEKAENLGFRRSRVIEIPELTRGQAETALIAIDTFKEDSPVLIWNIDTCIEPAQLSPEDVRGDGWIPVFKAPGEHWSFAEVGEKGRVIRTTEKQRISDFCSVGMYYFSSSDTYRKSVIEFYNSSTELKEWYIAPVYNRLIQDGAEVFIHLLPEESVMILGTPEELRSAERRLNSHGD